MLLHIGVGIVVVDGFKILRFHCKPSDVVIIVQFHCNFPDNILHKHRVVIGLLGDVFLIFPFEYGIDISGGRLLDELDQVLDPYELLESHLETHLAPLVMGPPFADLL